MKVENGDLSQPIKETFILSQNRIQDKIENHINTYTNTQN